MMSLVSGDHLGTYQIVAPLGAGGMGEVYRAKDLRLGRDVAIKVLHPDIAASPGGLARFEREARAVAGLNHPNVVTLFSVEEEDGIRFLTMELIEGEGLADLVCPGGLSPTRLLDLSIPLADAVAAAHERGIVHRDLKPGNVMLTRDGRVKVLDFGLSKIRGGDEPASDHGEATTAEISLSGSGARLGTIPYMAPEQVRGEAVDARADVFALGVIIYELATGLRPFAGATSADIASAILRDAPEPLACRRSDLPRELDRIVSRCLEKDQQDRPQTAQYVAGELRVLRRLLERNGLPRPAPADIASIAVMPFANRSRSEEDEYFADGLADELLGVLAKIRGLRVAARASSFHFKGKDYSVADVGRALNVATVLDGSVRKSGNRVRISVQLVKVADGYHLWSDTYDRTLDDIFAVQDDIAQSVVKELRRALLDTGKEARGTADVRSEVATAAKGRGTNVEAHRLYLQARHFLAQVTRVDLQRAIECLRQALEMEPGFALGWTQLGVAWVRLAGAGWVGPAEGYGPAREAAERALVLEPDLAEAHELMGRIHAVYDFDWRGAEASYRRALELDSENAQVLCGAGELARILGRSEEGVALTRRAVELDPLGFWSNKNLGLSHWSAGSLPEAEAALRRARELNPRGSTTASILALVLLEQGRGEEALAIAGEEPNDVFRLHALARVRHALGQAAGSDEALRELEEVHAGNGAMQVAEARAFRGEIDQAFVWLERAYAQRDAGLVELRQAACLRSLQGDPRWAAFLRRMHLDG
jgi:serine/threonine protein kinase/tetratricopeptide (TPR) repeat protein